MKKIYLACILLLCISTGFAQQTVEVKNKLGDNVTEKYSILKDSTNEVRDGLYQCIYGKNIAFASGHYTRGKKTGLWHFFNKKGRLMQNYNYDIQKVLYEAPTDSAKNVVYVVDKEFTEKDTVTKPIIVGGSYYGYLPYVRNFYLPQDIKGTYMGQFSVVIELLVSPGGRLADYKVHVTAPGYDKVAKMSLKNISEGDKIFIPAYYNGEAISSTVLLKCRINNSGKLVF
ncbi:hypothetical protein [Mucilaginibacter gynuensis]|uniref:hypothetical protein n=1 Tax=Mucilaginibacter gynuensis TaxID=1302236 RepID=UPI0031F0DC6D